MAVTLEVTPEHTGAAQAALAPFAIHDYGGGKRLPKAWSRVRTRPDGARELLVHPRVGDPSALPEATRAACEALGGRWGRRELDELDPAVHAALFTVVFFSKSRNVPAPAPGLPPSWRRVLSNFHPAPVRVDGHDYASVEHCFQAAKASCSDRPELARGFRLRATGPSAVGSDPAAAKRAGGRGAYAKAGASLDVEAWAKAREGAMERALAARWQQQPLFRAVLEATAGFALLHFERSGARSFWGGSLHRDTGQAQGENRLGRMLMALRDGA